MRRPLAALAPTLIVGGTAACAGPVPSPPDTVLQPQLGTPHDLRIVVAARRVDVFYNGAHAGGALAGDGWYVKTGSYIPSNVSRGNAADPVGRVMLDGLAVKHSG